MEKLEAELSVGPQAIDAFSRLSYTMWFALAEFVDNSTQSRLNYEGIIDDVLRDEGRPLTIEILHNRQTKEISIKDNSIGMTHDDLINALRIACPTPDSKGRSKYGMGMKTAACWIGAKWTITTCEWGSGEEWTAEIDVDRIANHGGKVQLSKRIVDTSKHYTIITIKDLRRVIQRRTEETIKNYLGSIYMFDLKSNQTDQIAIKLTYNGEEIIPPEENEWDTDPSGVTMMRDLPEFEINGKKINGWIGVLRKGGRKFGGFSLFQSKRQIKGFPNAWKPKAIFGGVDDEGANNLISQRLTGILLMEGFVVSHTKDEILFEGNEEDEVEKFLIEQTREYKEYAKSRRGKNKGYGWSREMVRDLVCEMQPEFASSEVRDALQNTILPSIDVLTRNNQKQLESLTKEEEIISLEISPDLEVIVSMKEVSEWEPYVTFVPGAKAGVLHVIINGLHPYYQTLEAKDSMYECIHQYIFDAVSEFKVSKLTTKVYPQSINRLKNELLRARADQLNNADENVRKDAEANIFSDKLQPPNS